MRPMQGIVVGRGAVRCENGVTYHDLTIPKGIKWYTPVSVFYDLIQGRVVSVEPESPPEDLAELDCHTEACSPPEDTGDLDDIVETDGSGAL